MATRHESTTSSPFANVPSEGKHICYDRFTRDHYVFFNGNFLGCRARCVDAEQLADDAARGAALAEGYAAGFNAGLQVMQ